MLSCITLARHVDNHSLSYAGRDGDLHNLFTFLYTGAAAVLTLVLYHLTFTVTCGADTLLLHHAEDALCCVGDDTLTMTGGTCLLTAASLSTRAVAMRTRNILAHLELLGDSFVDLLKGESDLQSQVTAAMLLWTA